MLIEGAAAVLTCLIGLVDVLPKKNGAFVVED
jgi:hypothetical protein